MDPSNPRTFVQTESGLVELLAVLARTRSFALDTESNSFHAYFERVCLLQISTPEADFVVDPFAVDVRPLGPLLSDPAVEKVMHAADYDIRCLKREWGFQIGGLFDTMLAAKALGLPEVGLAALVKDRFGVSLAKANQRSDWGRRPLSTEQLDYAFTDTRFLLPLRSWLEEELQREGKLSQAKSSFRKQEGCVPRPKRFDPEGYRGMRGFRGLTPAQRPAAKALYLLREDRARAADRPPFKVFGEDAIIELARQQPSSIEELRKVRGLGESAIRQHGEAILAAIAANPEPRPESLQAEQARE